MALAPSCAHSARLPALTQIYNLSGYPQAVAGIERDQAQAGSAERHKYDVPKRWLMYQVRAWRGP